MMAEDLFPGRTHLERCPGCGECDHLMGFYTACDNCGDWMSNECEHYYNQETGETLCFACEPKSDRPTAQGAGDQT